ncbi:hypothetical protein L7F22_032763 [Adiantum nelumboides]|nr:hypothetical protein [Adiantum nelumboides]
MSRVAVASFAKHESMVLLSKGKEVGKGAFVQSLPHKKLHGKELSRGTLGISIKSASKPGFSLPYVPSIDNDIDTLNAAIGTVVAWPIRDLMKDPTNSGAGSQASKNPKGGLQAWHKPIASTGVSMALRSDDVEKIQIQKERIKHKTLSKNQLIEPTSQVVESKQKTRATNDDDPTWEIPVTKKERSAMTNTQKKSKPHVNEAKDNEETSDKATAIEKKRLLEEVEVSKIALSFFKNVVNTRDDASDEKGEEEGAEGRGLFTITEKSTLKWYLLDETMRRLEVTRFPRDEGFVLGIGHSHIVADGSSVWHFMKSWASDVDESLKSIYFVIANMRSRVNPPLPEGYFGNAIIREGTGARREELLQESLGTTALCIQRLVQTLDQTLMKTMYGQVEGLPPSKLFGGMDFRMVRLQLSSSPRFPVYDVDFGWGPALSIQCPLIRGDGEMAWFPGPGGGGSIDISLALKMSWKG